MRPAPTMIVRRPVRLRYDCTPVTIERSARREAPIAAVQRSASTTKNDREKSPIVWVSAMYASVTISETATAHAIAAMSRLEA